MSSLVRLLFLRYQVKGDKDVRKMLPNLLSCKFSRKQLSEFDGEKKTREDLEAWLEELEEDRKSTRLNSSHSGESRMPSSA